MRLIAAASGGFLLAVLWMDLMFDMQVLPHRGAVELPASVLDSVVGYYHRATTTSRPMSYLIAAVMAILLCTLAFRWYQGPDWRLLAPTLLAGGPVVLALTRTVPDARRLGNRAGTPRELSRLARSICRDHLLCFVCVAGFLALWLSA